MLRIAFRSIVGLFMFALVCEAILRVLPVSTATLSDYYVDKHIITYPKGHRWTVSTGWDLRNPQRLNANNYGFAAHRDFLADASAVALVGDSYVEASMLPPNDRPAQQLERALQGRPVYAMGGPGSSLLDYAERIRFARENFDIRDFVVLLERGDIKQSLCGSGNNHGPCLERTTLAPTHITPSTSSRAKEVLRFSAIAQYVMSHLKLKPDRLMQLAIAQARPVAAPHEGSHTPIASTGTPSDPRDFVVVDAVAHAFFGRIQDQVRGRLVLVVDADRRGLRKGVVGDDPAVAHFIKVARSRGATVVDLQPIFSEHVKTSSLSLEVGPYDGHMNALAVDLAMRESARQLLAGQRADRRLLSGYRLASVP